MRSPLTRCPQYQQYSQCMLAEFAVCLVSCIAEAAYFFYGKPSIARVVICVLRLPLTHCCCSFRTGRCFHVEAGDFEDVGCILFTVYIALRQKVFVVDIHREEVAPGRELTPGPTVVPRSTHNIQKSMCLQSNVCLFVCLFSCVVSFSFQSSV